MRRVVLLGATGHWGERARRALVRIPGVEVVRAARRPPPGGLRVDLTDPNTLGPLLDADLVVDCSSADADLAGLACLDRGGRLLVTSAERLGVGRVLARRGTEAAGEVVVGGGIFPGLTNLLAHAAWTEAGGAERLRVGIAMTPLSGAGSGLVDLMTRLLTTPTRRYEAGRPLDGPPISAGPQLPFERPRASLHVPFCEPEMLHLSLGAPDVAAYLSPPTLLRWAFLSTPAILFELRPVRWCVRTYLAFLRRVLFRWRVSPVELVATAGSVTRRLRTDDGLRAGGVAIAAVVEALLDQPAQPGVHLVDERVGLDDVLRRMRTLGGAELTLSSD